MFDKLTATEQQYETLAELLGRAEVQSDNPVFLAQRERLYEGLEKAGLPE